MTEPATERVTEPEPMTERTTGHPADRRTGRTAERATERASVPVTDHQEHPADHRAEHRADPPAERAAGGAGPTDAEVAVAAALAGAEVVRRAYGAPLARVDKGGGDFATTADLEAERAVLAVLRAARPGDAVIGEEGGRQGGADTGRQWWVDPLCGTLNYAAGTLVVAVNVAVRGGGRRSVRRGGLPLILASAPPLKGGGEGRPWGGGAKCRGSLRLAVMVRRAASGSRCTA